MSEDPTNGQLQTLFEAGLRALREDASAREERNIARAAKLETRVEAIALGLTNVNHDVAMLKKGHATVERADHNARKALESFDDLRGIMTREISDLQIVTDAQNAEIATIKKAVVGEDSPLGMLIKESHERSAQMRLVFHTAKVAPYLGSAFLVILSGVMWIIHNARPLSLLLKGP